MKPFLRDITVALIVAVVGLLACTHLPYKRQNITVSKRDYIEADGQRINTLVMGSSIAEHGIDPAAIGDSCFNLGIVGQPPQHDAAILKKYLPRLENVKRVIYLMHYNILGINGKSNNTKLTYFATYKIFGIDTAATLKQWLSRYNVNYRYLVPQYPDFVLPENGYTPNTNRMNDKQKRYNYPLNNEDRTNAVAQMLHLAQVCQSNGVELIVVVPPFSQEWLSLTNAHGLATVDTVLHALEQNYHVRSKSYMNDADFISDTLFSDWNHLNDVGATLLSQKVKHDFGL